MIVTNHTLQDINTTNVEFIVDAKVLFHGWFIYSYLQICKLIKCKWLPGECADWFFDNIMTWSYCLHRRWYSMSRQKNSTLTHEQALKWTCPFNDLCQVYPTQSNTTRENARNMPFLPEIYLTPWNEIKSINLM